MREANVRLANFIKGGVLMFSFEEDVVSPVRIKVIGVGGAG